MRIEVIDLGESTIGLDGPSGPLVTCDCQGGRHGALLSVAEAANLHTELGRALADIARKPDPHHGKLLTIGVREDVSVVGIWRELTWGASDSPIYPYASYILGDLQPQVTNDNIAAILAWAEANSGHPFTLTVTDAPDGSDGSAF